MRLGIDASSLRLGGGITHLAELLRAADPGAHGIDKVVVWGGSSTLSALPNGHSWLERIHEPLLDRTLPFRTLWSGRYLATAATRSCDLLFVPGGTYVGGYRPFVTMARNMLPFDWPELRRYAPSPTFFRLLSLRVVQGRTLRRASGVIFLTEHARARVLGTIGGVAGEVRVIPHGVADSFRRAPRRGASAPRRFVYVSIVDLYKHQWVVAEAFARLRSEGFPVEVDFVGPAYPPALRRLQERQRALDPAGAFLRYKGPVPFASLPEVYANADALIFASTCENMPNILLEAMASGLPIVCSDRGPMREVLGEAGVYCNPEDASSIASAARTLLQDLALRDSVAAKAAERALGFSWARCASETLSFLAQIRRER